MRTVAIACQGGGSHTAFTGGALQRLLADGNHRVVALSGTSGGAVCALLAWYGLLTGGAAEAGKFLRVPGTNPFFPLKHGHQGNRFWELLESSPMEVYLMNTGRVGGGDSDERSKKVRIQHSSALVKGIAEGTIEWEQDPDFGYQVARSVPGIDQADEDILQPRRLYESQGRKQDYQQILERLKNERREYMKKWEGLNPEIAEAIG